MKHLPDDFLTNLSSFLLALDQTQAKNRAMKPSTLNLTALAAAFLAATSTIGTADEATTDPVGFYTLSISGSSDNIISVPMTQPHVFAGTVQSFTSNTLTVLAGTVSPGWTTNQFVYNGTSQTQTFFVTFASGALQGLYYKITANTGNTLTLDTEGDDLTNHPPLGSVAANDAIRIQPYWRIKDIFESAGTPVIESRPAPGIIAKDDILIPNYAAVGTNKSVNTIIYHVAGTGWRAVGQGLTDYANYVLRPNEAIILRRRNAAAMSLVTTGAVQMIRSVSFVAGGDGASANDTYISMTHPAPVSLDNSGLRIADQANSVIKDSPNAIIRQDELLAFNPSATGFNKSPSKIYYYLAGSGWREVGNNSTTVGQDVILQPGVAYIVRKKATNSGVDWVKNTNY